MPDTFAFESGPPSPHGSSHAGGGSDAVPAAVSGGAAGLMTGADKAKVDALPASAVPTSRTVTGADGCSGGGALSSDQTITLPAVGPGASTIGGGGNVVESVTLDAKGRVTAATVVAAGGGAPAAHAASHASGGGDAVSLNASQIAAGTLDAARLPSAVLVDGDFAGSTTGRLRRTGAGTYDVLADNYSSADPTVNDDEGDGYGRGTFWYNLTGDSVWTLLDETTGAAVWKRLDNVAVAQLRWHPVDRVDAVGGATWHAATDLTAGTSWRVMRRLTFTGVRFYVNPGMSVTARGKLWAPDGTELRTADVVAASDGVHSVTFASPYTVDAADVGKVFTVSVYLVGGVGYTDMTADPNRPWTDKARGAFVGPYLIALNPSAWAFGSAHPTGTDATDYPVEPVLMDDIP